MATSKRKKIIKILLHIFAVLLFVFATSYALLAAYGYQIDLLHRNIVKTSIIDLVGEYKGIHVYLNEKEVSDRIPYQIKNIKPESYKLSIKSEKYKNWKKVIEVIEDFVTIVDDIYLIPKNLSPYTVTNNIKFNYDNVVFTGRILIFIGRESEVLYLFNLEDTSGGFSEITLLDNMSYDSVYAVGDRYIAFEDENIIDLYDISSNEFVEILLPDEFSDFNIVYTSSLHGIYTNNGSLFSVDISDKGVFNEITLLAEGLQTNDVEVYTSGNFIFVKLDNDLYEYKNHLLTLIVPNIFSEPKISPFGNELLYLSDNGEVHIYSFDTSKDKLIGRFSKKIDYIAWLFDGKHIFLLIDNELLLCDLSMTNCPVLIDSVSPDNIFISQTKPLMALLTQEGISTINLKFN